MKNTKGITLIALIITIIVMLILVAVSISVALNTGLFKSAGDATKNWKSAQDAEANVGSEIKIGDKTYASIEDYLNNNPMSTIKINMEVTHEDTAVTADGTNIKSIEHGAPIPVGYSYVTGEKNTGVVIQDDDTSDQFVWVPVLQNQKIKIEIEAKEAITEIELLDPTGTQITTPAPSGKTYTASVEPTRNGEYKLTVKTASDATEKLMYVSTLYAQDRFETRKGLEKQVKEEAESSGKTELEVLEEWSEMENPTVESIYFKYNKNDIDNANMEKAIVELYKNSVNKYGGFYIARYEAGQESKSSYVAISQANKCVYNSISQVESKALAEKMNNGKTNVTAGLINGATWDRTLNWIMETNISMSWRDINEDSTSWGNYYESDIGTIKPKNTDQLLNTGETEYTCKNNIYDLAGNCWEWTTEAGDSSLGNMIVIRGGSYADGNVVTWASVRSAAYLTSSSTVFCFRSTLYINL